MLWRNSNAWMRFWYHSFSLEFIRIRFLIYFPTLYYATSDTNCIKKKMVRIRNIKTYLVLGIVNKSIPSAALENPHVFLDVFLTCDHLVSCLYWYHPNPTLVSWIIIRPLASSLILNQQGYPCRLISPEHGNPANAIPLRCTVGVWHSWKSVAPLVVRFWLN